MQKAGSLLYAIYVCLLISILTGGLILVFALNSGFSNRLQVQDLLIDRCASCLEYYFFNRDLVSANKVVDLFGDGLVCSIDESDWGMYKVLKVSSFFKKDTITKNVLVGKKGTGEKPALYLSDLGEELKLTGNTKIKGDVVLPQSGYRTINIMGNSQLNKPSIDGLRSLSKQALPQVYIPKISLSGYTKGNFNANLKKALRLFNAFDQKMMIIDLESDNMLPGTSLKGNIMLISRDTITLSAGVKLEDVLIMAPKVVVEDNFVGRVQIFAEKQIDLGKNVRLEYPSSAMVWSNASFLDKAINISDGSVIEGPVLLGEPNAYGAVNGEITIEEGAMVIGDLYCTGRLQHKGTILGSVYTNRFLLKTKNGEYTNTLMDATIDVDSLSGQHLGFVLMNTNPMEKVNYGLVKQL